MLALCRTLREQYSLAAVTNDIFTQEDGEFLIKHAALLPPGRIRAVETGGCPHAAIREDISINLGPLEELSTEFKADMLLCESGGDNLAANFSRELADFIIYIIDVSGGDKIPRKGGPGITQAYLLVVNKTDLAPTISADLSVMEADALRMRDGGPLVFAQVKHGVGVPAIVDHVLTAWSAATGQPRKPLLRSSFPAPFPSPFPSPFPPHSARRTAAITAAAAVGTHRQAPPLFPPHCSPQPPLQPDAQQRFVRIKQAYQTLTDPSSSPPSPLPSRPPSSDAQERFVRIKQAYQTLTDPDAAANAKARDASQRQQQQWARRNTSSSSRARGGYGAQWDADFSGPFDPFDAWKGPSNKPDDFYSLDDFFKDLQKDFEEKQKERGSGKPKSLWEELADLGEDLVDFLEKNSTFELTQSSPA
ncbi:unnamed protein product [Closterium sp. Naga37s-1]|nr:unnamed protein product [Closterium sp. Naga37s-1]